MITQNTLSHILYTIDPIGTCCAVNKGMENEYDVEAKHIINMLCLGVPFRSALFDVFTFFFWDGCFVGKELDVALIEAEYYNHTSKFVV